MLIVNNIVLKIYGKQLFVFHNRDLKTQNVFMKKKGDICKIGETVSTCMMLF